MRFLLDENIHRRLRVVLLSAGHDVADVPKGSRDLAVFRMAVEEGRALLTHDKDFADTDLFPPTQCAGMLLLCINPLHVEAMERGLLHVLKETSAEQLRGKLVLVFPETFEFASSEPRTR